MTAGPGVAGNCTSLTLVTNLLDILLLIAFVLLVAFATAGQQSTDTP